MNTKTKLLLDTLLVGGLAFTVGNLLNSYSFGLEHQLQNMSSTALICSFVILTFSFLRFFLILSIKADKPINEQAHYIKSDTHLHLSISQAEAFDFIKNKIENIRKWKMMETNLDKGIVRFRSRLRWKSWGEIVEVRIEETGQYSSFVRIISVPIDSKVREDYGFNRQNVQQVEAILEKAK